MDDDGGIDERFDYGDDDSNADEQDMMMNDE